MGPGAQLLGDAEAGAAVRLGDVDDEVSLLQLLTVIAVIPMVIAALIVAAVLLPALARGEKLLPSTATPDQWFCGPGLPAGEVEDRPRELGPTGGASGNW